jgi:creatinine amidohydrolase/Fe(II)-dependent formamide hydrolase-like protein
MKMRSYYLGELTWPDVKHFLAVHDVAVVPVGSCEQHGPHLPIDEGFERERRNCLEVSHRKTCRFTNRA